MSQQMLPHPDTAHRLARDAERDNWLRHQGFTLIRYWNSDILANPDGVLASLAEHAAAYQETAT